MDDPLKGRRRVVSLPLDVTNAEIKGMIRNLYEDVVDNGNPFGLLIDVPKDEDREVWEIPGCREIMGRLVDFGFISLLKGATFFAGEQMPCGLGAMEVWAMSGGWRRDAAFAMDSDDIPAFEDELIAANQRCDSIAGRKPHPFEEGLVELGREYKLSESELDVVEELFWAVTRESTRLRHLDCDVGGPLIEQALEQMRMVPFDIVAARNWKQTLLPQLSKEIEESES